MKKIRSAAVMVLCLLLMATISSAELFSEVAVTTAREFARMIDSGKIETAYTNASELLQLSQDQLRWDNNIKRSHTLLGPVEKRTLVAVRSVQTFPHMPDGDYLIVQFTAQTTHKSKAAEVILMQQQGTYWLVADYSIREVRE